MQTLPWMVLVEAKFAPSSKHDGDPHMLLEARGTLLLKGLIISHRLSVLMHTLMSLHLSMALPFPKRVLKPLAACAELLKSIESTLTRRASVIGAALPHNQRLYCGQLLALRRPHPTKLEASRRRRPQARHPRRAPRRRVPPAGSDTLSSRGARCSRSRCACSRTTRR